MARSWLTSLTKPGPIQSFDDINVTKTPRRSENVVWGITQRRLLMFSHKRSKDIPLRTLQTAWEVGKPQLLNNGVRTTVDSQSARSFDTQQTRWPQPQARTSAKYLMFSGKRGGHCPAPAIEVDRAALTRRLLGAERPSSGASQKFMSNPQTGVDTGTTKEAEKPRDRAKPSLSGATRIMLACINPRSAILPKDYTIRKLHPPKQSDIESNLHQCKDGVAELSFSAVEEGVLYKYFMLRDIDESGTLDMQELFKVLDDLGRLPPEDSEYRPLLWKLKTEYDADASGDFTFPEFLGFIGAYYKAVYFHIFSKYDTQGDQMVNVHECKVMLDDLNAAGFVVSGENLLMMLHLVDSDFDALVSFSEFCELMKHYRILEFGQLKKNAGLSAEEMTTYTKAFESCDTDGSGTIDIREATALFMEIGKPINDIDRFVKLFSRMDDDRTASLDFEEFVRLIKVWEKESLRSNTKPLEDPSPVKKHAAKISRLSSVSGTGTFNVQEASSTLHLKAVGTDVEDGVFAAHWDLPLWEVRALRESFEYCDTDGSGVIDSHDELVTVLSCMGIELTTGLLKREIEKWKASAEAQGMKLDFSSVVRFYAQYAPALARAVFESTQCVDGCIPLVAVISGLYQVGRYLTKDQVIHVLKEVNAESTEHVDELKFAQVLRHHQSKHLRAWIGTYGFSSADIDHFTEVFMQRSNGENTLAYDSVFALLETLDCASGLPSLRCSLLSALARVDRSGSGQVSFSDVLLLLRHLKNQEMLFAMREERKAAEEIGLDADACVACRKMFCGYRETEDTLGYKDASTLKVSCRSVKHMLIHDLAIIQTHQQRTHLDALIQQHIDSQHMSFTFVEFLRFMNQLDETGAF